MSFSIWDAVLVYIAAKLLGTGGGGPGPVWPGPTGPTGPGPTGPTGPATTGPTGPAPTGPTGPGPTGPTGPTGPGPLNTDWKPYTYKQPDAGASYGTPYALAAQWTGSGNKWKELYNYSRKRMLSDVPEGSNDYAYKGDLLLIPFEWNEPTDATILARCEPIAPGTTLPTNPAGSPRKTPTSLSGEDDYRTI